MAKKNKVGNWGQRLKVKAKLLAPVGIKLSESETMVLAAIYEDDASKIKQNEIEINKAIRATETMNVRDSINDAVKARSFAVGTFKQTKDPIKKREWARRVVVADHALKSMRDMKNRMEATRDRLTMIKGDVELQLMEAEARAAEAQAYAKAGKQLRLVGQKLVDARTRAKTLDIEYANLEVSMEGAEMFIDSRDANDLIAEANRVISRSGTDV